MSNVNKAVGMFGRLSFDLTQPSALWLIEYMYFIGNCVYVHVLTAACSPGASL